ncbi:MAG: alpha/beta fold hydrolase [Owenweeksia sp.]|nr:alpha/beta fold hydrolase [Owenweeksia sp.]
MAAELRLSGALMIPRYTACDSLPLAVYEHGTVLKKNEVPSRDGLEAFTVKVFASAGAIAVAPDYLGLGDNPGLHPYLHGNTEATATLDLIRAVREFLHDSTQIEVNSEIFVTGYSQGGHAAMATLKYVSENGLQGEFNIIGAGPASGPYHLSGSQKDVLLSGRAYSNPAYVVYLLLGMNRVYGNIFQNYSDLFKPPYDSQLPPLFTGSNGLGPINALLPDTLRGFIRDSVLDNFASDSVQKRHPIWQALLANDNHDWKPTFPVELYYCTQDEQVTFLNALAAETAMQARGANVNALSQGPLDHGACFLPSMQASLKLFLSLSNHCNSIGLPSMGKRGFSVFPNPASDELHFEGAAEVQQIEIIGPTGNEVYQGTIPHEGHLNVKRWPRGIYLLNVRTANGVETLRLILRP